MPNNHNLSLKRSEFAWNAADKAKDDLKENFGEYVTLVKNLPARISNSGLGQTLAFLRSKGKKKENLLLDSIGSWLIDEMKIYQTNTENANQNLMQRLQSGSNDQYRWATSEMMELITWLKLHSSSLEIKNKGNHQTDELESRTQEKPSAKNADKSSSEIDSRINELDAKNISDLKD